jgi:hypothetical protein
VRESRLEPFLGFVYLRHRQKKNAQERTKGRKASLSSGSCLSIGSLSSGGIGVFWATWVPCPAPVPWVSNKCFEIEAVHEAVNSTGLGVKAAHFWVTSNRLCSLSHILFSALKEEKTSLASSSLLPTPPPPALGIEPRAMHVLGEHFTAELHPIFHTHFCPLMRHSR